MAYTVFVPDQIHEAGISLLRENGARLYLPEDLHTDTVEHILPQCDAAIAATYYLNESLLSQSPRLKLIVKHGSGIDNVVNPGFAASRGICVHNIPGVNSTSVAEHIVLLMLACARNLIVAVERTHTCRQVNPMPLSGTEVAGKTLGILGLGNVGRAVAHKAHFGLDMKIAGYDKIHKTFDKTLGFVELLPHIADVCRVSDFVCVCLPLTPETKNLIDKEVFAAMKPSACLINIARGGILQEDDLYQALLDGQIAFAALDVLRDEKNWCGSALTQLPNVIVTPHIAAMTEEALRRMSIASAKLVCDDIHRCSMQHII